MPQRIHESVALNISEADTPGRLKIGIITPGWGSSGYYPQQVLENAATERVYPKGTQMFLDHPTETESYDRPERSVRDLAAVLETDAVWDGTGLVAEAKIFKAYRELLTDPDLAANIGVSVRGSGEATIGEAEGRRGQIFTRLVEGKSVDFVTKPGRGGRVLAVLESARADMREASINDTRDALETALKARHGAEGTWVWVRDFDPTTGRVWFLLEDADTSRMFEQGYALSDDGTAILADEPATEVRARTEYVPVTPAAESGPTSVPAPAGQSTATESEGDDMATTQIEESRLAQLEKDSERVQSLESERDADRTALSEAHRVIDNGEAHTIVRTAAREADISLNDFEAAGIAADYPKGEDGRIDKDKLAESAKAAVATLAESRGAGSITGFGSTAATVSSDVVAEAEEASAAAFGRTITKEA